MTDEQFTRIVDLLERIEHHLSKLSGVVFVDEIETGVRPIDGVVSPPRRKQRQPPRL